MSSSGEIHRLLRGICPWRVYSPHKGSQDQRCGKRCHIIMKLLCRYKNISIISLLSQELYSTLTRLSACYTVYPKKYAHGFCFAVLCCGYTLTDFPISIRLTSLALWQSNDCPSASKATLMNMDKYFMWIHYERLHNHNKAKHNKTVCIFLGIYCMFRCGKDTPAPLLAKIP